MISRATQEYSCFISYNHNIPESFEWMHSLFLITGRSCGASFMLIDFISGSLSGSSSSCCLRALLREEEPINYHFVRIIKRANFVVLGIDVDEIKGAVKIATD